MHGARRFLTAIALTTLLLLLQLKSAAELCYSYCRLSQIIRISSKRRCTGQILSTVENATYSANRTQTKQWQWQTNLAGFECVQNFVLHNEPKSFPRTIFEQPQVSAHICTVSARRHLQHTSVAHCNFYLSEPYISTLTHSLTHCDVSFNRHKQPLISAPVVGAHSLLTPMFSYTAFCHSHGGKVE